MRATSSSSFPVADGARSSLRGRTFRIGLYLAISNTLIGAAQPVIIRYGAVHLDPMLFLSATVTAAAICALALLYVRGELPALVQREYLPYLFLIAMAGTATTSLTLVYGLRHINAISGVILLQSEPVYSLLLAAIVLGERPSLRQLVATATILLGIGSAFGQGAVFSPVWAAFLVLLTPLFWQTAHVLALKLMPPLSATCITGARLTYAALVLLATLLYFDSRSLIQMAQPSVLGVVVFTGFLIYFLSSLTWYGAINRLSLAWTTALVVPGTPLLSTGLAIIFLGEHATARELIGILIAVSGILALGFSTDPHRRRLGIDASNTTGKS